MQTLPVLWQSFELDKERQAGRMVQRSFYGLQGGGEFCSCAQFQLVERGAREQSASDEFPTAGSSVVSAVFRRWSSLIAPSLRSLSETICIVEN